MDSQPLPVYLCVPISTESGLDPAGNSEECLDINECESDPCQNQGTCLNREAAYECQCVEGYTGTVCETDIDECANNPCENGARFVV